MELYNLTNYSAGIIYINNVVIYELDIEKANINILYELNGIDEDTYNYLLNAERMRRQVYIGNLLRTNPALGDILKAGILEAKKKLFLSNNIESSDILSIKNDAVFIINRLPRITKFGLVNFRVKNKYIAFYKIGNKEFYYLYNKITKNEVLDIKGMTDDNILLHNNFMIDYLKHLFRTILYSGIIEALKVHKEFYNNYINRILPVGYYRTFNENSYYPFKEHHKYIIKNASDNQVFALDISYNLSVLTEIQKLLMTMYFNSK